MCMVDFVDAYTQKLALPFIIRAIVALTVSFREYIISFLSMRTALFEKWLITFMHGIMRNGLFRYEAYQVYARTFGFALKVENL